MKIISYLNVSNISNLEADSGFVFQNILLSTLYQRGYEVFLIGPHGMNGLLRKGITPINIDFSDTKYGVRLGFCWSELKQKLIQIPQCDILIVNQSELLLSLKTLIYEVWGKEIPCITYFHYLPIQSMDVETGDVSFDNSQNLFHLSGIFWKRQIEAANYSDFNIIGSNFGKKLFIDASKEKHLADKFCAIPPPTEANKFLCKKKDSKALILIYNHRLYGHYGTEQVFKILKEVGNNINFSVIVTDPTGNRSTQRENLDDSVSKIKEKISSLPFVEILQFKTQEEYLMNIANADIGIGHFRVGSLWSMSIADLMVSEIPTIGFNSGGIREVIQDDELLCSSPSQMKEILEKLLLDTEYRHYKGKSAKEYALSFSPSNIADKFESIFNEIIK